MQKIFLSVFFIIATGCSALGQDQEARGKSAALMAGIAGAQGDVVVRGRIVDWKGVPLEDVKMSVGITRFNPFKENAGYNYDITVERQFEVVGKGGLSMGIVISKEGYMDTRYYDFETTSARAPFRDAINGKVEQKGPRVYEDVVLQMWPEKHWDDWVELRRLGTEGRPLKGLVCRTDFSGVVLDLDAAKTGPAQWVGVEDLRDESLMPERCLYMLLNFEELEEKDLNNFGKFFPTGKALWVLKAPEGEGLRGHELQRWPNTPRPSVPLNIQMQLAPEEGYVLRELDGTNFVANRNKLLAYLHVNGMYGRVSIDEPNELDNEDGAYQSTLSVELNPTPGDRDLYDGLFPNPY